MQQVRFIPNGNAQINKQTKILTNWLYTKTPSIKKGQIFSLLGLSDWYNSKAKIDEKNDGLFSMQVDSSNGKSVSSNIMNIEAFVKI